MQSTLKKALLTCLLLWAANYTFAQKALTNSRYQSYYTYIYKITTEDVARLYKFPNKPLDEKTLHNPVDSFKTDKYWENTLPAGNYLKVFANKNQLSYSLIENHTAFIKLLHNDYDQRFIFLDKQGNTINNGKVYFNGKPVLYDEKSATYHVKSTKKINVVQIEYAGISNFFNVKQNENYGLYNNNNNRSWLQSVWASIKGIFKEDKQHRRYKYKPGPYTGFMVFNKPKYKPNDTVKFKAYILNQQSKKPIAQKSLLVKLREGYGKDLKLIGTVNSYRDGGFEYSFVLRDSLDLSLDEGYTILLVDPNAKKTAKADNENDSQPSLMSGVFRYEEYELKSTSFNMRLDKKEHWRGNPLAAYFKATDENDLPSPDGRVTLTLTKSGSNRYANNYTFVPDTLWVHKFALEPVGETKVIIPDSIFPAANVDYNINAEFLNSENESRSKGEYVNFSNKKFNVTTQLIGDTLKASYQELGKDTKATAFISALSADNDTISKVKVTLPSKTIINPAAASYNIKTDNTDTDIELKDFQGDVSIAGGRNGDSISVKVNNPRNLHLWYSVFVGDKLIDEGEGSDIAYKKTYTGTKVVSFWVNYIWSGESKTEHTNIVERKDMLTINVKQPLSVYPGQQVKTDIVVTDVAGKPVANADLTAWAITRKFDYYQAPPPPYLGRNYIFRKSKTPYESDKVNADGNLKLKWNRWSRDMGLDSIKYYQFTHPKTMYSIEEPGIDTVTQIAPFIVKDGDIVPVHILYIDEKPVYFSQAQQLQRYSFKVSPGKHMLRFRTSHLNIKLDSVIVKPSKKLIISLNADAFAATKQSDTLDTYEADLINNYMITVIDNFDQKMAMVRQDDRLFFLNPSPMDNYNYRRQILTGPISDRNTYLEVQNEVPRQFVADAGYSFLFEPGLLKQKSIATKYPFNTRLSTAPGATDYTQYFLTQHDADNVWEHNMENRSHNMPLFINDPITEKETGQLNIEREIHKTEDNELIKNVIIYSDNNPDFIRIYSGNTTDFGQLATGKYRLFFLLHNDAYYIAENIVIKPNGVNNYKLNILPVHAKDSVSIKISNVINNRTGIRKYSDRDIENDALKLKEAFNERYLNTDSYKTLITGQVVEKSSKLALAGVSVKIKGTTQGTQTNAQGNFSINVPANGKLIFSFIGYQSQEIAIKSGDKVYIVLEESQKSLNEVAVIGYGSVRKREMTGSVSVITDAPVANIEQLLQGKVSGLIAGAPGFRGTVQIRGISSISGLESKVLYIIDGNIAAGMDTINPADILSINVLKDAAAVALYGVQAKNGAIIITTKKGNNVPQDAATQQSNGEPTLRKNFSDYAYWQPKLLTDAQGHASFTATYPDDITNWRTFVTGITDHQQTGFIENQVKSYKPISANFIAPQFAVAGDELNLIGKVLNYNAQPVNVNRTFTYNGKLLKQGALDVKNSLIDTLNITADATDSLTFEYSIKGDKGYSDGERRKIPVMEQGVKETKGIFEALNNDTTVSLKFDPALGPVTFRAEASVLPALAEEARKLREYKYLCNEQLASKLIGLLNERRIKKFLGEPFKYGKNITEVIKKLQDNRKSTGTWGWWKDTEEELWISLHAVNALLDAQQNGYQIQLDNKKLTDYLVYQLESYKGADKLTCLELLHKLDAKVDYAKYAEAITKENAAIKSKTGYPPTGYDKLRLMLLKQQTGVSIKIDSLLSSQHHTMFGNIYWGEDSYRFFDNSIQLSALAYQILKEEGKHTNLLAKIRGYFLEQRSHGEWRNTYESALILNTILPDMLVNGEQVKPVSITIKGSKTEIISQFPYTATLTDKELSISKTGTLPAYITGYQQFWNAKPEKINKDFTVNTSFEKQSKTITQLKGGEAVELKAEVTAKGDADFVMVEIPIPAGCSYESKEQSWTNNEVHREYFKEKVSIFCRKLKQGKYTFIIKLMPRYDGKYTLNPAKAEMMYFPVFYGREGMKKVVIGSVIH
ncbi:TonB-dependent outer membrane receptor, SusC/RagA subfamily, signature region [Mucilaginibacter pineti]|uniref:TonB-dependent outer membrane receptor, SusC/RagA subfamily, signature region n=1 Tax=Mucilaginibacter pineti TaxID=1391627 RepID=A0A1G7I4I1_9SPHI|nr:carboxypeptidase-like regulatory domain-containing protein [Mucilaginibacter pineti]SDF07630.1 TonB-dependent outer membrane receptor, SusC/RagA subfamily, signature region [Mucilaginibacter pineti]